jgi:DNA polymerase-3 subunit delta'
MMVDGLSCRHLYRIQAGPVSAALVLSGRWAKMQRMAWDIIGHEWASGLLREHIAQGAVRHAYLLAGPPGIGKRTLALQFVQALNCMQPPSPGESCGGCRACRQIQGMQFSDLLIIQPEEDSTSLKIDQIRAMQHDLALAPYEGRWKVALIQNLETASIGASNALLKTLEEPAKQVVVVGTAGSAEALLPTIVSRCELIALRPVGSNALRAALQARGANAAQAEELAKLAGGCPGRALAWLGDASKLEQLRQALKDHDRLLSANLIERFDYARRLTKGKPSLAAKDKCIQLLQIWLSRWRDVMLAASGARLRPGQPEGFRSGMAWEDDIDARQALEAAQAIEGALSAIERNANLQLVIECLMLDLPRLSGAAQAST